MLTWLDPVESPDAYPITVRAVNNFDGTERDHAEDFADEQRLHHVDVADGEAEGECERVGGDDTIDAEHEQDG